MLSVKGVTGGATMELAWLEADEWGRLLGEAGFAVEARYGWFDRKPYRGGEDTVWVARRTDAFGHLAPSRADGDASHVGWTG